MFIFVCRVVITARTESLLREVGANCLEINPKCNILIIVADVSIKEHCKYGKIPCLSTRMQNDGFLMIFCVFQNDY